MTPLVLDHLVVMVRSLEASLPWYSALFAALGFDKTRDHVWWNGTVALDLKEANADTPDYQRYGVGLNHMGFTAPDRATLDRVRAAMADAGFEVPELQPIGTMLATFFKDPDGMRVEVTHYS